MTAKSDYWRVTVAESGPQNVCVAKPWGRTATDRPRQEKEVL